MNTPTMTPVRNTLAEGPLVRHWTVKYRLPDGHKIYFPVVGERRLRRGFRRRREADTYGPSVMARLARIWPRARGGV